MPVSKREDPALDAPPIVAESSAPGNRSLHLMQKRLPGGLVWPQVGQRSVDFIGFLMICAELVVCLRWVNPYTINKAIL